MRKLSPAMIVALVGLFVGLGGVGGAATGDNFILGQPNAADQTTSLAATTSDPALSVRNNSTGIPLNLVAPPGRPPFKVNSGEKVANLNADLLDGKDSTALPYWKLGGNAGTVPGTNFLGTTDNNALVVKVNGQRALRIEPTPVSTDGPNIIGGFSANGIRDGAFGVTISGGGRSSFANVASDAYGTVGGGVGNIVGDLDSAHSPGTAQFATVGGGHDNRASGFNSIIGGGAGNTASGFNSTVAGGVFNVASGDEAAVAGGGNNTAGGINSFAAGAYAKATQPGSFVWGDRTFVDLVSPAANTFTVRASGGVWLGTDSSPSIPAGRFINTSTGGYLSSAGVWTNASDRTVKHGFRRLDAASVLGKVARLPITSWSYKAEKPSVRHIGPMAQDFYAAFGLGLDDKHITTIDEGGVALVAIQGLYRQNKTLRRENRSLRSRLDAQNARLTRLEQIVSRGSR
jgi:hypothetical protein